MKRTIGYLIRECWFVPVVFAAGALLAYLAQGE